MSVNTTRFARCCSRRPIARRSTSASSSGILLLLGLVELVLVPLVGLLFNAPVIAQAIPLAGLVILGTLGFASVGTLFAAMLVRARSRDVLLPIMLYPMTVPVMIAGVRGTAALFQPAPDPAVAQFWLALLARIRRGVRHPRALDVRAGDDRVIDLGFQMSDFGFGRK